MVETRTIESQLAEERPQYDLVLSFVRADCPALRTGNLLGQIPRGLGVHSEMKINSYKMLE